MNCKRMQNFAWIFFLSLMLGACGGGGSLIPAIDGDNEVDPSGNTTVDCGDDADDNGVGDLCQVLVPTDSCGADDNGNGVGDACEVEIDSCGADDNGNGVGDSCEVEIDDCGEDLNANGVGDDCEVLINECGEDLNGNGVGDDCEVPINECGEDLNGNGIGDDCEVPVPSGPQVVIDTFKATPGSQIFAGETITIEYAVSEAEDVYLDGDRLSKMSDTLTFTPEADATYLLWANNEATAAQRTLRVAVDGIEQLSGSERSYHFVRTSPHDTNVVFAGRDEGLYKSTDGGESFESVGGITRPVNCLAFDPTDPEKILIGTDGSSGTDGYVMVSSDGGAHFEATLTVGASSNGPGVVFTAIAISPADPERIYATYDLGLAYSNNGGAGWLRIDEFGGKTVNAVLYAADGNAYFGADDGLYQLTVADFSRVALEGRSVTALGWDNGDAAAKLFIGTDDGEIGTYAEDAYTKIADGFDAIKSVGHLSSKDLLFIGAADGVFVSRAGAAAVRIGGDGNPDALTSFDLRNVSIGQLPLKILGSSYRLLITGEAAGLQELRWSTQMIQFYPIPLLHKDLQIESGIVSQTHQ